jgi:HEPN domain-containing protein
MEDINSNITQARKWIISVINDIERVKRSYEANDYADSIYRCQFAIEKINKAILILFGFQLKRTHTPSKIIGTILKTKKDLFDSESKKILEKIIEVSKKFEKLKTTPKYGFLENGDYILPEEIYSSKEEVKNFLKDMIIIIKDMINLLNLKFSNNLVIADVLVKLTDISEGYETWLKEKQI